ncbi:MAG: helix-turn-helix domain-containing protein [Chloroflexota bacterium]|nr:helix-turn-helix domain-containing protein [Chloroflexota bacterium]
MLTVPEAARRLRKNPETLRRWIREGKLRSTRVGTQHLVDEADLDQLRGGPILPAPAGWWIETHTGEPLPDFMTVLRRQRRNH